MLTGFEGKKQCINYFIGIYIFLVSKNDYSLKANRNFLLSMRFFLRNINKIMGIFFWKYCKKKTFFYAVSILDRPSKIK